MNPSSHPEEITPLSVLKILKLGDYYLQCSLLFSVQVPSVRFVLLRNEWKQTGKLFCLSLDTSATWSRVCVLLVYLRVLFQFEGHLASN